MVDGSSASPTGRLVANAASVSTTSPVAVVRGQDSSAQVTRLPVVEQKGLEKPLTGLGQVEIGVIKDYRR